MLLSCPAKKVTKECGIGEARTWHPPEHLNGQNLLSGCGLADSGGSALAALPIYYDFTLRAKNRNIFCPNRIEVKVLRKLRKCAPGVSKGAALIAGAINSAPLGRLLLVLFLARQEKYILPHLIYINRYTVLQKSTDSCEPVLLM